MLYFKIISVRAFCFAARNDCHYCIGVCKLCCYNGWNYNDRRELLSGAEDAVLQPQLLVAEVALCDNGNHSWVRIRSRNHNLARVTCMYRKICLLLQ